MRYLGVFLAEDSILGFVVTEYFMRSNKSASLKGDTTFHRKLDGKLKEWVFYWKMGEKISLFHTPLGRDPLIEVFQ